MLPDPTTLSSAELHVLAQLHLSSAHNLMTTLKLLSPAAFAAGSSYPDLSVLDDADNGMFSMASTLIDMQLFHLTRAAMLVAHSRQRLRASADCSSMDSCTEAAMPLKFLDL